MLTIACKNDSPKHSTENEMPARNEVDSKTIKYEESGNFENNPGEKIITKDTVVTN